MYQTMLSFVISFVPTHSTAAMNLTFTENTLMFIVPVVILFLDNSLLAVDVLLSLNTIISSVMKCHITLL